MAKWYLGDTLTPPSDPFCPPETYIHALGDMVISLSEAVDFGKLIIGVITDRKINVGAAGCRQCCYSYTIHWSDTGKIENMNVESAVPVHEAPRKRWVNCVRNLAQRGMANMHQVSSTADVDDVIDIIEGLMHNGCFISPHS